MGHLISYSIYYLTNELINRREILIWVEVIVLYEKKHWNMKHTVMFFWENGMLFNWAVIIQKYLTSECHNIPIRNKYFIELCNIVYCRWYQWVFMLWRCIVFLRKTIHNDIFLSCKSTRGINTAIILTKQTCGNS